MEQQTKLYMEMAKNLCTGDDFEVGREFRLLEEAKDILDEVRIMRDISSSQSAVLRILSRFAPPQDLVRSQDYFLKDKPKERAEVIEETVKKAASVYEAIIHLIDLKQKQGNLSQATTIRDLLESNNALASSSKEILNSTNETLQQSEKSGKTLMVVCTL